MDYLIDDFLYLSKYHYSEIRRSDMADFCRCILKKDIAKVPIQYVYKNWYFFTKFKKSFKPMALEKYMTQLYQKDIENGIC